MRPGTLTSACHRCERIFTLRPMQRYRIMADPGAKVYCSKECFVGPRQVYRCTQCGNAFDAAGTTKQRAELGLTIFCSKKCVSEYKSSTTCSVCGSAFKPTEYQRRTQSTTCFNCVPRKAGRKPGRAK